MELNYISKQLLRREHKVKIYFNLAINIQRMALKMEFIAGHMKGM